MLRCFWSPSQPGGDFALCWHRLDHNLLHIHAVVADIHHNQPSTLATYMQEEHQSLQHRAYIHKTQYQGHAGVATTVTRHQPPINPPAGAHFLICYHITVGRPSKYPSTPFQNQYQSPSFRHGGPLSLVSSTLYVLLSCNVVAYITDCILGRRPWCRCRGTTGGLVEKGNRRRGRATT